MTQFNASTYSIERTTGICAFTERVLEPHEHYIATLVEDGDELVRVDISPEAWEAGKRPEHLFSYWKAVVPEPNEKKKTFVDDEVLLNLLERLADAEQPQRIAFRFVLTLILMRKKLLRYDKTIHKTVEYTPPPTPEPTPETPTPEQESQQSTSEQDTSEQGTSKQGESEHEEYLEQAEARSEDEADTSVASDDSDVAEDDEGESDGPRMVEQDWWVLTPKLDPTKGPMSKWDDEKTIEVLDPHLDDEGIRMVTDQLSQILEAEL